MYGLLIEVDASDETAKRYIDTIHSAMEKECPNHSEFIRIKNG
jgi:hypothetical protein